MANWLILSIGILLGAIGMLVVVMISCTVTTIQAEQSRKKQTQSTEAGLMDTLADLNNVEFNLIEINTRINTIYQQVELAKKRQAEIRRGPYEYPKEGPMNQDGRE